MFINTMFSTIAVIKPNSFIIDANNLVNSFESPEFANCITFVTVKKEDLLETIIEMVDFVPPEICNGDICYMTNQFMYQIFYYNHKTTNIPNNIGSCILKGDVYNTCVITCSY